MSYLDEAIALERDAAALAPWDHADRAASLSKLAGLLHSRFQQLGKVFNLEEAVIYQRCVVELRPEGHPDRPVSLGSLGLYLYTRFKQLGMLSDLDEALALERSAVELYPLEDPDRASALGNIASYLHVRSDLLGTQSDFEEALSLQRTILELRPKGHPYRSTSLGNIATALYSRFNQFGRIADLEEAISLERSALELRPQGHPDRASSLESLGNYLHFRFHHFGRLSDLEEALAFQRNALQLYPEGHPQRAPLLDDLALCLRTRFKQFGALSDLEEALAIQRNALELLPEEHPRRACLLSNFAHLLYTRSTLLGALSDLEEALAFEHNALELASAEYDSEANSLTNLAHYFCSLFAKLGSQSDLDEAVSFSRNALELSPHESVVRTQSLGNLANYLNARFKHSTATDTADLQEAFNLCSRLCEATHPVSPADLACGKSWIQAAEDHEHSTTILAYQTFSRLSSNHLATLPPLPQHFTLIKELIISTPVDAFSACVRYGNHPSAVELLEQGRGVFWSQLICLRSPLGDVIGSSGMGKELARKFTQVVSLLRGMLDSPPETESQHNWALHFNVQLQGIVAEIRELPGFSRFFLPPPFSDLQLAAIGGPVIIVNASRYSCDALLVLHDKNPVHVALQMTRARALELSSEFRLLISHAGFRDVTRELLILLRELWDRVVSPIVEALQTHHPLQSRIWWCPTAEFSNLPLHAASSFRQGEPTLSDLYVSSYAPTLTALIRTRQKGPLDPCTEQHRVLVVGQAQTPGQDELIGINAESLGISQRIGPVATLTCVQNEDATVAKVAEELEKTAFVHLACRGIPNGEQPFESGFAMGDGLLQVQDIMRHELQNAQFAYLSAGRTTVGDEESPDQVIHLAAAMQFAGFRSVVATMGPVDDGYAKEIASQFYEYMLDESGCLDHTRAALALHKTMSCLSSKIPLDQRITYVHMGV